MSEYIISCCSTADLSAEYVEKKNIPFVCFHYTMDGKEREDDLGKSMHFDEFYAKIAAGAMPTTSQVNVEQYLEFFMPFLEQGKDILHLTLSTGLSGSYNSAVIAKNELQEKYPERKIMIVDTLGASSGYGLIVDTAYRMRDNGKNIEEAAQWLEENKLKMHHWFFSSDLTHYKRGGRISAASATFGTMLNICPLMNMNNLGELIPRQKIRGKKHVIEEIVKKMETHAQDGLKYSGKCFISQSACYEDAKAVADLVEDRFPELDGPVVINNIGTVIGSHTGPGTVALFFWGDERVN